MEINCKVPCFFIFKILNSCPTKELKFKELITFDSRQIFELFMVLLSTSPYFFCFVLLLLCALIRTTRSIFMLLMIFVQNYLIELLKNTLKDPRPNFECNNQYGNPSNHAVFYSSFITWWLCEYYYLSKKFRFKYDSIKLFFVILTPFVLYSRIYLNYHKLEQIFNGIVLGIFIAIVWFIVVIKFFLKSENFLRKIFTRFGVINNLTDDHNSDIYFSKEDLIRKEYDALSRKQKYISELKDKIKSFKDNMEKIDIVKNAKKDHKNIYNKFEGFNFDKGIHKILNKKGSEFEDNDLQELNNYLSTMKKHE